MSALRQLVGRVPGLGGWDEDPLWGSVYDWSVEHPVLGGWAWRLGIASDLQLLYAAADETGRLPAGSVVLDVPSGGGVALRGLRPGQGVRYVAVDISRRMLDRTEAAARRRGVADQLETVVADVVDLPFADGSVDHVVSLTGLHCFPDPRGAVREVARVLRPSGVLTGSALLQDSGLRFEGVRRTGRLTGLLGPGATRDDVRRWLAADGFDQVTVRLSGAIGYFRGVRTAAA